MPTTPDGRNISSLPYLQRIASRQQEVFVRRGCKQADLHTFDRYGCTLRVPGAFVMTTVYLTHDGR